MSDSSEIFKEFKEHSVAEFFKKNRHMLGYSGKVRSLTTAVHELVTNSLDACEEAGILPDIQVKLDKLGDEHYRLAVKDNGPGIPPDIAPRVFGKLLAGTKFHRMIQTRGQQGIGAAGVTLFSQITTGKPVKIITSTGDGTIWEFDVMVDVTKNEPDVKGKRHYPGDFRGTEVIVELKEVEYNRGKYSVYEYLRRTALANPHTSIRFVEPDGKVTTFERSTFEPVKIGVEAKPHPFGVSTDDIFSLSKGVKSKTVARMLGNYLHGVGNKAILAMLRVIPKILNKPPADLTWEEAERIVHLFRVIRYVQEKKKDANMNELKKMFQKVLNKELTDEQVKEFYEIIKDVRIKGPSTDVLIPIGEERIRTSLRANLKPSFVAVVERKPRVYYGGIPFQVEVGIAVGGKIEGFELMRFANRVPLLFDSGGCAITEAVRSIDWNRYGMDVFNSPVVIMVNISSTHIPYTTAGKQAIADVPEVYNELRQALMEAGRKLKEYTSKVSYINELMQKKKILEHYLPLLSKGLAILSEKDEKSVEKLLKNLVEERYKKLEELMRKLEGEKA